MHALMAVLDKTQTEIGSAAGRANGYTAAHSWLTESRDIRYADLVALLYEADWLTDEARTALREAQAAVAAEKEQEARDRAQAIQRRLLRRPAILRLRRASQ